MKKPLVKVAGRMTPDGLVVDLPYVVLGQARRVLVETGARVEALDLKVQALHCTRGELVRIISEFVTLEPIE